MQNNTPNKSLATRYTYFDNGQWRIKINDTEYSCFPWIDRLAAFEDLGLEPAEVQRAYDICVQFLNSMDGISLTEVQEYAKAKKEGRVAILPEGTKVGHIDLNQPAQSAIAAVTVDPLPSSRAALLNRFSEAATRAFRSNQSLFVCPVCEKNAKISDNGVSDGFKAECPHCGTKISKW